MDAQRTVELSPRPTSVAHLVDLVDASLTRWNGSKHLRAVMRSNPNTDVFLVGGALREHFLAGGHTTKDYDFFIHGGDVDGFIADLSTEGEMRLGPFGSPRWKPKGYDSLYADIIPVLRFHNGLARCSTIIDALRQFDFTANAVALDLRNGQVFDPVHGISDARSSILRAVRFDYPDEPITLGSGLSRLGVLWLRMLHYSGKLAFGFEPTTLSWMRSHRRYIEQLDEFKKVFFSPVLSAMRLIDGEPDKSA
jgi:hypothetical protein